MEQEKKDFSIYLSDLSSKLQKEAFTQGEIININQLNEKRKKIIIFFSDMIEIKKKYILYIDFKKRYKRVSYEGKIKAKYQSLLYWEKELHKDYIKANWEF